MLWIGNHFFLLILASSSKTFEKVVTELQHSQLSVLEDKETCRDWLIMLDIRFGNLQLVKLINDMTQIRTFYCWALHGSFIIRKLCKWMATAILNLIATRTVRKQLQFFRNNTGVETLDFLTRSIDSGLMNADKAFHKSVLNETNYFCAYKSKLQAEWWQGSKDKAIG